MTEFLLVITLVISGGQTVEEVISRHSNFASCQRALNKFDMTSNKSTVQIGCYKPSKD